MRTVIDRIELAHDALAFDRSAGMMHRIENIGERRLEHFRHFLWIDREHEIRAQESDDRQYCEPGVERLVGIEEPRDLHRLRWKADLLFHLAQRGPDQRLVVGVITPARKAD